MKRNSTMPSDFEKHGDSGSSKGRTTLEKILLFLLFLNIAAVIVLGVFLGTSDSSADCDIQPVIAAVNKLGGGVGGAAGSITTSKPAGSASDDVCTTEDCVKAASNLILSLDISARPCQDFYKFACGGWMSKHEIPEAKSRYSTFTLMRDDVDFTLRTVLQAPVTSQDEDFTIKAKNLYTSCMDIGTVNQLGASPVNDLISQLGGWPLVTKSWKPNSFKLSDVLLKVAKYNLLPVLEVYVGTDLDDPTKTILNLDQPRFGLPGQKYYLGGQDNEKYIDAYKSLILGVAKLIGFADQNTSHADVDDIVEFESKLANISDSDEARRNPYQLNNPMTIEQVDGDYSIQQINMSKYIMDMMALPGIDINDIKGNDTIINMAPNYFNQLKPLLETTPSKILANYIVWRSVFDNIGALDLHFRNVYQNFRKDVYGMNSDTPRGDLCVGYVNRNLGFAAGTMFLQAKFANDSKKIAMDMITHIQAAFNDHLKDINWMDQNTKNAAKDKNNAINRRIGYGDNQKNNTYLSEFYAGATVNNNTFFENVLSCKHRTFIYDARGYGEVVDKAIWTDPPQTVNAYYSPNANQITFPAGILQPPFFNGNFPKYLNYGAMGSVIGHEITHGFDDQGRQFDKNGRLYNWWTNETSARFVTQAKCIIDQYSNFYHTGSNGKKYHVNGVTSLGENLADNGGVKISFQAYTKWASAQGKQEPKLPGLNYTANQMFFINFAQTYCGLARDEQIIKQILTDPHSPGQFRPTGSLQNLKEFSDAFHCQSGAFMNPVKKCNVW